MIVLSPQEKRPKKAWLKWGLSLYIWCIQDFAESILKGKWVYFLLDDHQGKGGVRVRGKGAMNSTRCATINVTQRFPFDIDSYASLVRCQFKTL